MRSFVIAISIVFACILAFGQDSIAGQSSTAQPDAAKQSEVNEKNASKKPESSLGCHAEKSAPNIFWGFWNPSPAKEVSVKITFGKPASGLSNLDCVGEPLELTVPNGQRVTLTTLFDHDVCASTSVTASVTRATADSPVADILALGAKVGVLGFDQAGNVYALDPQKDKVVSIDATCKISADRKSTQNIKITYQNPPRIAVSTGFLLGTTGIQSYGIKTVQTGVGTGGVVNTQNSIAVTGSPTVQFIPFGFVNLYIAGSRRFNLGPQMGIGVNPNLSTAKVEFFAAPIAIGWHDFYFSPGFHIGQHERLTGGFSVGELTPSNLSKAPIGWTYYTGLGFSFSYNLKPLVKGGSSSK